MALNNFTGHPSNPSGNGGNPTNPLASALGIQNPAAQSADDDPTQYLINYNEKYKLSGKAMFRDNIVAQTMGVLIGKNKPNPMLVGPAGVGKTKIAEDIAYRLANNDPTIPDQLKDSVVWELPLSNIVAGSGIVGQIEEKVKSIVDFASDPDNHCILFIDEIHQLAGRDRIYSQIAQILKPALARGDMKVIGATTLQESQELVNDPAFNRRFTRIIVDELTRDQTIEILKIAKPSYINHYGNKLVIDDTTLNLVATIADQYAKAGNHRPDTALTLLDRACGDAIVDRKSKEAKAANDPMILQALKANPIITLSEPKVKNTAMRIATGQAEKNDFDSDHLKQSLSVIKGQDDIIETLVTRLAKADRNLFPRRTPLTFLFAGTSGVGKTEVTKIIAEELTGMKPITLNMTEYHSPASINRIIGAPAGYVGSDSNAELPFDILESNPYQVILLDEFEKADKAVQRLFMGAFDEGFIKTSKGTTVDFSKAIIIATTNASHSTGASKAIGFTKTDSAQSQTAVIDQLKGWFDTELLNRFTKIVTFHKLTKDVYKTIIADIYKREMARIKSEHRGITAPDELDDATIDSIANDTYVEAFGARPARKAIQDYIEEMV